MEPISIMLIAAVITKMITTHQEEMEYARHGKDSPRYRAKLARLAAQGSSATPARLGAKGYIGELWHDAWDDLAERRQREREARKVGERVAWRHQMRDLEEWARQSLNRRADGTPVDDMLDVADVRPTPTVRNVAATTPDEPPIRSDQPASAPQPAAPADEKSNKEQEEDITPSEDDDKDEVDIDPTELINGLAAGLHDGVTGPLCDRCNRIQGDGTDGRVTCQCRPEPRIPATRIAPVIPLFPNTTNIEKEITMATSEVTGLSTAIAFALRAATAHASFSGGGTEGYIGALARFEVGEGCIGLAREAQEASQIAAAKWAAHAEALEQQMNVKEAYQGNPDAGNKEFLLNG